MRRPDFDLNDFMPYLLNQATEKTGLQFSKIYRGKYGMLRTEWRVLFHLGRFGDLTAAEVGRRAKVHKTKISRAVRALENKRFLQRGTVTTDRRHEMLRLTPIGRKAFTDLTAIADGYNRQLASQFSTRQWSTLQECLKILSSDCLT